MIFQAVGIDKNIIHEYQHSMPQDWFKDCVRDTLKCSWGISEPKWHHKKLIETTMCSESYFMFIPFSDSNLMMSTSEIKFRKLLCTSQLINKFIHYRQGMFILDNDDIQVSVVNTKPSGPIFFLNQ